MEKIMITVPLDDYLALATQVAKLLTRVDRYEEFINREAKDETKANAEEVPVENGDS